LGKEWGYIPYPKTRAKPLTPSKSHVASELQRIKTAAVIIKKCSL
jgi:hypothetical protein